MLDDMTPLVIVSSDTHIGPLLKDQLRSYCPATHLRAFDDYIEQWRLAQEARIQAMGGSGFSLFTGHPNMRTSGHYDVHTRLRDMDRDGVACEVIFHGSQNNEPIPFTGSLLGNIADIELDRGLAE